MTRSMTGYGVGRASRDGLSAAAEVRSVNNRFLDIVIKTPRALFPHENEIRELVQARLSRGRISVFINEEWNEGGSPEVRLDIGRAKQYHRQLQSLSEQFGLSEQVRLEHLLTLEDLILTQEDEAYRERLWTLAKGALIDALSLLVTSAEREGTALHADIEKRLTALDARLQTVSTLAKGQVEQYRRRLTQRLEELLGDDRLDRNRLETEIAIAADKLDITEEIVRLGSHLKEFRQTLNQDGPTGKTLGFVLQEMGREANTIASKSWTAEISHTAIQMKELLEQIREQLQNLE